MSAKERNITSEKAYRRAEDDELYQSRAENKLEMVRLKDLAGKISLLSKAEVAKLDLSEEILAAIVTARKIVIRTDAYSRHQAYMVKLIRSHGEEKIQAGFDKITNKHNQATVELTKLEGVRDNLIEQGDSAINEIMDKYPDADRQKLRQLVRQANKEKKAEKPMKAGKEIFKYLRELAAI